MSRDMQIGLLLAVGFLALVGGVLFYRIEHPDELEQYLGSGTQAQGTVPAGEKPDAAPGTLAFSTPSSTLPPAPDHASAPPIDTHVPSTTNTTTGGTGNAPGSNVVLASGAGTNPAPPAATMPTPPANSAMPLLDLSALDKKPADTKPLATAPAPEVKKSEADTASRSSLPTEPPTSAPTLPTAPANTAPSIAFDIPKASTPPAETKKPEEKKPVDVVVKPEGNATTGTTPPAITPPSMSPPSFSGPTLPVTPPSNSIGMTDTTIKPTTSPLDLNKSQEMPLPPVVTPPAGGTLFDGKSGNVTAPTTSPPNPASGNTPPPVTDADGFRTYPPKVGLGKPLAESEATLREKRWADNVGSPSPIIPSSSSSESRGAATSPASGVQRDRRVVQDTYIPTERALRGETFSSLSQRLYGDTNYAVALAAFNKEEGFVKMDQPEPNEWVAKPNREILDQRYPHLVRRLSPSSINHMRNNGTLTNNPAGNAPAGTAASTNHPTYRVGKGEQLFEVAKKTLGDGYRWSEIYALNKELLRDSTELRPDMMLKLPVDAKK